MNKLCRKIIYALLFCLINSSIVSAQTDSLSAITTLQKDTTKIENEIPDLNFFLESAITNSPLLHASDRQIEIVKEQIKKEKKSWTDFVFLDANTKYGLYNQLTVTDLSTDGIDQVGVQSNKEQFNYYAGITFRIPISKFTSRKNDLKILNKNLEDKKFQKEEVKNQLQQMVVEQYYTVNYLYKAMKINQDMLQAFSLNLQKSERDLKLGLIGLEEYNAMIVQKGKVEDSFYKIQNEFYGQYKKLQIISGINLDDKK
ncbi:MAG: TolC family protein [Paludibacter sp.]|nr:TolC family protein [Paludibacter sp.]